MGSPSRDLLWQVAAEQQGYFTAAQATEAGFSHQSQYFHVQRGNWTKVSRGIYRFKEYLDLPDDGNAHFVRWALWSRQRAVVSHTSALAVHDLGVANPDRVHLSVPPSFRQSSREVVLHRVALDKADIEDHQGFRVTKPYRAIAETADLGVPQDVLDSAVTELLTRGSSTKRQLLHAAQRMSPRAELAVERALQTEST
ncbi:hypothetical protein GCM10022247_45130 [Allokutzneria multivorans]|uniref:Transcriptional regulator, AbiEi antitoxin, Type IV TA system n=1 Tax=Allokutzneria multivorans TaxID=1142134 RepID=A0ABP7SV02_9PSEU